MMRCQDVTPRLVAFQDGELAPGEHHQVASHLRCCAQCAKQERALAEVTPEPQLVVPPGVHARMALALDAAIAAELQHAPPATTTEPATIDHVARWLRRDASISRGALVAWAAAFAAILGWGLANYAALQDANTAPALADVRVPAEHYQPASFSANPNDHGWH